MMHNLMRGILLVFAPMVQLMAAPVGSLSGAFPSYTFTAICADPAEDPLRFRVTDATRLVSTTPH